MNLKIACLGALAATVLAGAALAGALDEPKMMSPFFTDASMKTMKSDADMKKVWAATAKRSGQDDKVMQRCGDEQAARRVLREIEGTRRSK